MHTTVLSVNPGLADSSRLPFRAQEGQYSDVAATLLLFSAGVTAALATALLDLGLRIPGHAIIRAIFPMSLGFALAPRRMGGTIMGTGALASALVIKIGGFGVIGVGAMTSLVLTGPLLDAVLVPCVIVANLTSRSPAGPMHAVWVRPPCLCTRASWVN